MAVIGIDLGTTNSLGCAYKDGRVQLIPNAYGSYLTPSVVSITDEGVVLVGEPAKEQQLIYPGNSVSHFKRKMGSDEKIRVGRQEFLPDELSSFVIRSIIDDAKRFLGEEIEEAIISVPAYFYDDQRAATKKAGVLAGVKVERIINEPSAAALANYFNESEEQSFLIFDFGGGTLDVSVVECLGKIVQILSISGDNQLGGRDFDEVIASGFLKEHNLQEKMLFAGEKELLLREAESCKKMLSEQKEAVLKLEFRGKEYCSVYNLERLAQESELILSKIKSVVEHAIKDAALGLDEIQQVVMVGGSSKMPLIQSYLRFLFRKAPIVSFNCDEQIAIGLGVFCGIKERKESVKDYVLSDICPFSLGNATYNKSNPNQPYNTIILERNSILPCSVEHSFCTIRDNQTQITIEVLQGEQPYAHQNKKLEEITVDVPKNKAGKESTLVRYTYDINGILIVDITVVSTGAKTTKVISHQFSEEELESQLKMLNELKVHPRDCGENIVLKERLQTLCETSVGEQRDWALSLLKWFEILIESQNLYRIEKARKRLEEVLATQNTGVFTNEKFDISKLEEMETEEGSDDDAPAEWEVFKTWTH